MVVPLSFFLRQCLDEGSQNVQDSKLRASQGIGPRPAFSTNTTVGAGHVHFCRTFRKMIFFLSRIRIGPLNPGDRELRISIIVGDKRKTCITSEAAMPAETHRHLVVPLIFGDLAIKYLQQIQSRRSQLRSNVEVRPGALIA